MTDRWSSGRSRAVAAIAVAVTLLACLGGCATMSGGAKGDAARSVSDAASAAQSAALALEQDLGDRSTDAVTGTTLDDMLDEVQTAATAVAELDVSTDDEAAVRELATASIRECTDSIVAARSYLGGGDASGAGEAVLGRLTAAAHATSALSDDLAEYR